MQQKMSDSPKGYGPTAPPFPANKTAIEKLRDVDP